jgi:hypothetical protein
MVNGRGGLEWGSGLEGAPSEVGDAEEEGDEGLVLLIFQIEGFGEAAGGGDAGEAGEEEGNGVGIGVVGGEELAEVLFFQFHDGEVDEDEDGGEDGADPPGLRGDGEAEGGNEGTEIEGVAGMAVGATIDEALIFGEMSGGPGTEGKAGETDGDTAEEAGRGGLAKPGEGGEEEEAGGDAETGYRVGVGFGEAVVRHGRSCSNTIRGVSARMQGRISLERR